MGISYVQARTISANEWAKLDAEGRKKYKDLQAEDRKRYLKELEAYERKLLLTSSVEPLPLK
jgi:hypothetical protein